MEEKTHFGFKDVKKNEKAGLVADVFSSVASNYDLMNDAMSGGLHRIWKDKMIAKLNPQANTHLLDVAGGTGDIAFRFLKKQPQSKVTISDINQSMLDEGKKNAIDKNILTNISWSCADAQKLPFEDNSFDYFTIAFGIRNVTEIEKALKEAFRVLKFGGRFLCLEFSKVQNPAIAKFYDAYSFKAIPKLGKLLANDEASYQYLVQSIRKFPSQEDFADMIRTAGFSRVDYQNMTFGVVALHSGWKI